MSELNDKLLEIKRQKDEYILPENLKKDVTVYGVTGTLEPGSGGGDIKLFDTVEHMQEDENAQDGDLAVVYREEIQPVTENSEFDSCIFSNTVVLNEAFTGNISGSFRAIDGSSFNGMLNVSSSSFRFDSFGGSSQVRVQYTSNDGVTYTRTDGGEELQEFGTTIKWFGTSGPFNNVIGNFMKIGGNYFDGLFEYTNNQYQLSPNQLSKLTAKDLLNDVTAFGGTGIVTGDGTIYDYLNQAILDEKYFLSLINNSDNYDKLITTTNQFTENETVNSLHRTSFGLRTFKQVMAPYKDIKNIETNEYIGYENYFNKSIDVAGSILSSRIINNELEVYCNTTSTGEATSGTIEGKLVKYIFDLDLELKSTSYINLGENNSYVLNFKFINDTTLAVIVKTNASSVAGNLYLKIIDLISGNVLNTQTLMTDVMFFKLESITGMCTNAYLGYDEQLNKLYWAVRETRNYNMKWGTLNLNNYALTTEETGRSSLTYAMYMLDIDEYIFISFNGTLFYFVKGQTNKNMIYSSDAVHSCPVMYYTDDQYKYLIVFKNSINSIKQYSKILKTDKIFNNFIDITDMTGLKSYSLTGVIEINNVKYLRLGNYIVDDFEPKSNWEMENYSWGLNSNNWGAGVIQNRPILITNNGIRLYTCYNGKLGLYNTSHYIESTPKIVDDLDTDEFLGYIYGNLGIILPLTDNYKDDVISNS